MGRGEYGRVSYTNGRGAYVSHAKIIGADPVTGPGGTGWEANIFAETDAIDAEVNTLDHDIEKQLSAQAKLAAAQQRLFGHPIPPALLTDPRLAWYVKTWMPWVAEWRGYRNGVRAAGGLVPADPTDVTGWINRAKILFSPLGARDLYFDAQKFRDGLLKRWTEAPMAGYHLTTPQPNAGNKPFGEEVKAAVDKLGDFGKYALIGVAALGGAVLLGVIATAGSKK